MKNYLKTALLGVTALLAVEASGAESVFQTYSFQPEENKAVAGISKLRMTFTNGDMNIDIDRSTVNTITMASSSSTFYCVNLTGFGSIWTMEFAPSVSGTASEIKENGEYTLTIPAVVFHYQSADRINDKITAKFIVSDDIDFDWTCFPANGSSRELPEYGDIDINISFTSATSVSLTPAVQGATYSVRLAGKDLTRVNSLDDGEGYRLSTTSNGLRLQVSKSLVKRTSELSFVAEKGAFTVDGIKSPAIDYKVTYLVPTKAIQPPYLNTFDTAADAEGFTILDLNEDGRTWGWAESEHPEGTYIQEMRVWEMEGKDDWLISPAIRLEAGEVYNMSLHARPYGFWGENFEMKIGTAPTVEGMNEIVIPEVRMRDGTKGESDYFGYFSPTESGEYYLGIHANTEKEGFYLYIDNLAVSAPMDKNLPESVSDFNVTIDNHNSKKSFVSFVMPDKNIGGNRLESLTKVELYRDGEIIKTFDNPIPGDTVSVTDFVEGADDYIYMVRVFNAAGEGKGFVKTLFVGVKKASFPTNVRAKETENVGEVMITWDAPATDVDGNPIDSSKITYYIVSIDAEGVQTQIGRYVKDTSYKYRAIDADKEQEFFTFGVFAETDGGFSMGSQTRLVPLGKAYSLPFAESFDTRSISLLGVATLAGAGQWGIYGEETGGVQAWDTDDSYAGMAGYSVGDSGIMFTGKIDLSEAVAPELSFYVYNFGKSSNEIYPNVLQIQADCGNDFEPVQTINLSDLGDTEGWVKRTVNLSGCKGKTPQLGFVATTKSTNFPYTFIDNVEVKDDDSGVDNVTEGSSAIHVNGHIMTIDNPEREHILVSTVNGVTVYSGDAATVTVDLASGLYVVKTGRTHRKIMVK